MVYLVGHLIVSDFCILSRIASKASVEKELTSRLSFPFGVWGRMWKSAISIPDYCLVICFSKTANSDGSNTFGTIAGWMTCDFTSFSTVFQSYQDDGRLIMKGCVQWSSVYS